MNKEFFRKIYAILPSPLEKICLKFENAIIYIFYGVLATIINYAAHFGLRLAFSDLSALEGKSLSALLKVMEDSAVSSAGAATFAWIVAVIFAFFTNKYFVFESAEKSKKGIGKEFVSFIGGRLFSYGCELAIMFILVDRLHLNELIIKIAANVVVLILNYIFSKFLVFAKRK